MRKIKKVKIKTVKTPDICIGDPFIYKDIKWICLDIIDSNYLAITAKVWQELPFDFGNHNNWKESSLRRVLNDKFLDKLNKNHLVRLYLMCLDILEKQEICTYRENDRDFLLSIRNGAFQNEDGTYKQEFFELISDYEARLQYAKENTSLPEKSDMKRIEEFVMSVNEKSVNA